MNSLLKRFRDTVMLIVKFFVFLLSKVVPSRKRIWVFGAHNRKGFGGNSKYLYLYVSNNCPDITAIWIGDQDIDHLQSAGYSAYYTNSLNSARAMLLADTAFVSHGIYDLNWWFLGRTTLVNLWHGTPIKMIGADRHDSFVSRLKRHIRTISGLEYDYLCLTGKNVLSTFKSAYNMSSITSIVTGYPRNDVIIQEVADSDLPFENQIAEVELILTECDHSILYAPTYRSGEDYDVDIFDYWPDLDTVDALLAETESHLFIKLHPHEKASATVSKLENVTILSQSIDVYPLLKEIDYLITDYSSIYIDYILSGGPVIFYPFDLEKYSSERGFYYQYDEITPGPVVQNQQELLEELLSIGRDQESYSEERIAIRERFFDEVDSQSAQRIYKHFS